LHSAFDSIWRIRSRVSSKLAVGAAYTPTSIDSAGRIYSQNAGHPFVAGN
jgi:hypothetical protein